ncbi:energy transducer TonB [Aquicoccus sp. SU-CL01552]|uniref:energy transducer TonB n=1 Tax=Aquicoccus sp. SU-CL01552 TaxID=3127656 RepID=UPI00310719B1
MQTGTKISALAHGLLLGWAFLGGVFQSDPLPYEVQDVSVISAEEFALMTGQSRTPEVREAPAEPEPPAAVETPDVTAEPDPPPARSEPEVAPEPVPEPILEIPPEPVPPEPESAALVPETPRRPQRPSERIAPEPVAPPPPEARPDPVEREEVAPEAQNDSTREAQEATAPEEAATEIVTEAEESAELAPTRSPRPAARPARRPPAPEAPAAPSTEDAVAAALAEALGETRETAPTPTRPAAPSGPPLNAGEKEALRVAVSSCWNVGSLSSEALATTVVVAVSLSPDGKPQTETIRLMSSSGGGDGAAKQAFEAARRAIIRCGAKGFDLPVEKYDHWRDIEMTFNPERMRIK